MSIMQRPHHFIKLYGNKVCLPYQVTLLLNTIEGYFMPKKEVLFIALTTENYFKRIKKTD